MKTTFGVAKFKGFLLVATFSMLIEFLMGFADSVIAGNLLGETALAGLNLLQSPMNFVSFVACLLGTGTAICFSTEIGRFDRDRAAELFSQGVFGAALFGVVGMAAFVVGRDAFLGMFGASKDVIGYAVPYWNWFVPNVLLEPIAVMLTSAVYADGGARLCFGAYIVQLFGNCAVSYFLCKAMGISGCALGSTVGNIGAILFISCHFLRRGHTLRLVRHFAFRDLLRICKSSFGDASVRLCWALLFMLLNAYVISRFGSEVLPVLKTINPGLAATLAADLVHLRADRDWLYAQAAPTAALAEGGPGTRSLPAAALTRLPRPVAIRAVKLLLGELDRYQISAVHLDQILALAESRDPSSSLSLPQGLTARRDYDRLILTLREEAPASFSPVRLRASSRLGLRALSRGRMGRSFSALAVETGSA